MKKFFLSLTVAVLFGFYVLGLKRAQSENHLVIPPAIQTTQDQPANAANPATGSSGTSVPSQTAPAPSPISTTQPKPTAGQYKDGQYTGPVTDAYYGYVRVKAIIQNGKLADVQFLQYPNDRQTSREINSQAMPYLRYEAIQAQSAPVDIISGATDTSQAFRESLAVALTQAKN